MYGLSGHITLRLIDPLDGTEFPFAASKDHASKWCGQVHGIIDQAV